MLLKVLEWVERALTNEDNISVSDVPTSTTLAIDTNQPNDIECEISSSENKVLVSKSQFYTIFRIHERIIILIISGISSVRDKRQQHYGYLSVAKFA